MGGELRGLWAALACDLHHAEQMANMREARGLTAHAHYVDAVLWCMVYNRSGNMRGRWGAFRAWSGCWEGSPVELEALFVGAGAVVGENQQLFDWDRVNGWILRKRKADVERQAAKRKAGKASARARRAKARGTKARATKRLQKGRLVGTVDAMIPGASGDAPRSSLDGRTARGGTVAKVPPSDPRPGRGHESEAPRPEGLAGDGGGS